MAYDPLLQQPTRSLTRAQILALIASGLPIIFPSLFQPSPIFIGEGEGDSDDFGLMVGPPGTPGARGEQGAPGVPGGVLDIDGDSSDPGGGLFVGFANDHHALSNLTTFDDHSQYLLLAGRAGSANDPVLSTTVSGFIYGSTQSLGNLNLNASTNTTCTNSVGIGLLLNLARTSTSAGHDGCSLVSLDCEFTFESNIEGFRVGGEADNTTPAIWSMDIATPSVDFISGFNFGPNITATLGGGGGAQT